MVSSVRTSPLPRRLSGRVALAALALASLSLPALAQRSALAPNQATRIADPKLNGGRVDISYYLSPAGANEEVIVELVDGGTVVHQIFDDFVDGSVDPVRLAWNGRGAGGAVLDCKDYTVRVRLATGGAPVEYPLSLVRLGITRVEARSSSYGEPYSGSKVDEWQMVYFKKGNAWPAYYATPATGEYYCSQESGDVSDLDLNNGEPKPPQPIHTATDEPVMDGTEYDTNSYNYPLCYLAGATPCLRVGFGLASTTAAGTFGDVNYPVPGYDIRCVAREAGRTWKTRTTEIKPWTTAVFHGSPLSDEVARQDCSITWSWQYRPTGGTGWKGIPGTFTTQHRFYTVIGEPQFAAGVTGTRYAGPWVEVADHLCNWIEALNLPASDDHEVISALILGYFGQQGPLTGALEGVIYDCYPMGGDGGANHYYLEGSKTIRLAALLNAHAYGVYLNCSDCAGSSSTMAAMMGVKNVQLVHLGTMYLRAIWGIGCPAYTTNLWGSSHGFSYHKIITRTAGVEVCDACMCLDEDGNPNSTPGVPGYNCDRPWDGTSGYNYLSATNNVSKTLQVLPKIQ